MQKAFHFLIFCIIAHTHARTHERKHARTNANTQTQTGTIHYFSVWCPPRCSLQTVHIRIDYKINYNVCLSMKQMTFKITASRTYYPRYNVSYSENYAFSSELGSIPVDSSAQACQRLLLWRRCAINDIFAISNVHK